MKSLDQQFADWVSAQPADAEYDYGDTNGCAFCQFLRASGYGDDVTAGGTIWGRPGESNPIPARIIEDRFEGGEADALNAHPRTFGALAERLAS